MSALVHVPRIPASVGSKWVSLLVGLSLAALCAFLLLPGSIAAKTHLALHGICAQRPSHSLWLGGTTLPLDARMTGIYIGASVTAIWLLALGNARNTRIPPRSVQAILGLFVVLLAGDGLNALAVDLRLPHPYAPSNWLRLVTGILGGTAMGVVLIHLLAVTLWARGERSRSVVARPAVLVAPVCVALATGALAATGLPLLYAPFAIGLLVAAVGVFTVLSTVTLALLSNRAWSARSYRDVAALTCAGLVVAIGMMAGFAGVRLLAEHLLDLPILT